MLSKEVMEHEIHSTCSVQKYSINQNFEVNTRLQLSEFDIFQSWYFWFQIPSVFPCCAAAQREVENSR